MKPRNKYEKRIQELHEKLPKFTDEQYKYADENCFTPFAMVSRNRLFCLECNHKWDGGLQKWQYEVLKKVECPCCKKELKIVRNDKQIKSEKYMMIIDKVEEFQVLRFMGIDRWCQKTKKPHFFHFECVQKWIDPSGKMTTFGIGRQMGWGGAIWSYSLPISIKNSGGYMDGKYSIYPDVIFPYSRRKIIPEIKRNGFKGGLHGIVPDGLFVRILTDPVSETLLKTKQYKYLSSRVYQERVMKFWSSIKICIRNGYKITDMEMWGDYLEMLDQRGKDLHSPRWICPENLKKEHDKLVEKNRRERQKRDLENKKKQVAESEALYKETKGHFFGICFKDEELTVKVMESVREFMTEGDILRHCVFASGYYKRQNSLVFSARIGDQVIETVEFSLESMEVVQARGMKNKSSKYNARIVKLVNDNMKVIQKAHNSRKKKVA